MQQLGEVTQFCLWQVLIQLLWTGRLWF